MMLRKYKVVREPSFFLGDRYQVVEFESGLKVQVLYSFSEREEHYAVQMARLLNEAVSTFIEDNNIDMGGKK